MSSKFHHFRFGVLGLHSVEEYATSLGMTLSELQMDKVVEWNDGVFYYPVYRVDIDVQEADKLSVIRPLGDGN